MAKKTKIVLDAENPDAVIAAVQGALSQQANEVVPAATVVVDVIPANPVPAEDDELLGKPFGQVWLMSEAECIAQGIDPKLAASPEEIAAHKAKQAKKAKKGNRKAKAVDTANAELAAANQAAVDAAFAAAKKADPEVTAKLEAKPEPAPVAKPKVDVDLGDLDALLFGDDLPFYQEMNELRRQAKAKFDEGMKVNLGQKRFEANKEAGRVANMLLKDAEREIYNVLKNKGNATELAAFEKLQTAFYKEGDPKLAARFELLRKARIVATGRREEQEANLKKAAEIMATFEELEAATEAIFEEGRSLYAQANEIAVTFGWEVTDSKKKKEVVPTGK